MVNTEAYVSTGHLPPAPDVQALVSDAYERFRTRDEGVFGICLAGTDGNVYTAGDAGYELALMSLSEPFVFALVCDALGPDVVRDHVGLDPIATTNLVPGANLEEKWELIQDGFARLAGRRLPLDHDAYAAATATNHRSPATELYTRQCALRVNAVDLALMGATLADGGTQPMTHDHIVSAEVCQYTVAVMPAKSAISGGIVMVSPGKGGLATFAPRLDPTGNSIKGQLAAKYLSRQLGLDA